MNPFLLPTPASVNRERRLVVHEPAPTEAPKTEEVLAVDLNAAEDIGHEDNVHDDEVLS